MEKKYKNILNALLVLLLSGVLAACGGSSGGGSGNENAKPPVENGTNGTGDNDTSTEESTEEGGGNSGDSSNGGQVDEDIKEDADVADDPLAFILDNTQIDSKGEVFIDESKVTLEVSREIFMPKSEEEAKHFISTLGNDESYINLMDERVAKEVVDDISRKAFAYQDIFSLRIHQAEKDIIPIDDLPPVGLYRPNTRHYFMPSKVAEFASSDLPLATTGALLNNEGQGVGFMQLIASGFEDEANPSAVSSEPIINCNEAGSHSVCEHGGRYYLKLTNKQTNSFYYQIFSNLNSPNERSIMSGAAIIQPKKGWVASGAFIFYPVMSVVNTAYRLPVFVNKGKALEGEISLLATLGNMPSIYPGEDLLEASRRLSYVAANVSIKEDTSLPVSPDGIQGKFLQKFKGTYIEPHKTFNTAVVMDVERATDENFYAYSIKGNGQFFYSRPVLNESGELEKDQEGWVSFEIEEPVFLSPNRGKMTISTSLASCEVIFNEFDADNIRCREHEL